MSNGQTRVSCDDDAKQIDPLDRFKALFQAYRVLMFCGVLIPRHEIIIETSKFDGHVWRYKRDVIERQQLYTHGSGMNCRVDRMYFSRSFLILASNGAPC